MDVVVVVDTSDEASIDQNYITYFDDEHIDSLGYDDNTDDDRDNNYDIYNDISVIHR